MSNIPGISPDGITPYQHQNADSKKASSRGLFYIADTGKSGSLLAALAL